MGPCGGLRRGRLVLAAIAGLVQVGCLGDSEPPSRLVDGSAAQAPSVALEGAASPQVETKATAIDANGVRVGPVARCLAATHEHTPRGPVVSRVGVDGESVTFRTASGRGLVACDGTAMHTGSDRAWCGTALGRLRNGRLLDPRLDLAACSTPSGGPVAFAWVDPGQRTRYVAVKRDGFVEEYPVIAGLPIRIAATSGIDLDTSSASFEVSEHDSNGSLLRSYTLRARVAG